MRDWKLEMQGIYQTFYQNRSYNIERLFIALEKVSKAHFNDNTMKDGDSFTFPMSNGTQCELTFYKDVTTAAQIGKNGVKTPVLRSNNLWTSDQQKLAQTIAFRTMGTGLKSTGDYIGEMFPEKLKKALKALSPGMLVSFTNGRSYVCTENNGLGNVSLTQVFDGDVKNLSIKALKNPQKIELDLTNNTQMQKFYNDNHKTMTQRVELNVTFTDKAKGYVELIERNLEYGKPQRINMGNTTLIAKKNEDSSVIWFDGKGDRVKKDDVIMLNAILNCGINERNYIRKNPTNMDIAKDVNFEKQMEALSTRKLFGVMYESMLKYVKENKTNLVIESLQYEQCDDGFFPSRIVFAERDGLFKAIRIRYKDNDFNKEEADIKDISKEEFEKMCEQIYSANHKVLATRTEEQVLAKLHKAKESLTSGQREEIDKYINNTVNNSVEVVNMNIDKMDEAALVALAQSYLKEENKQELSAKEIKDTMEL